MDDLKKARVEAVTEIASSLLKASGECLVRHGNDPQSEILLCAAVSMFIGEVNKLRPGFENRVSQMLISEPSE